MPDRGFIADPAGKMSSAWIPKARPFVDLEATSCLILIGEPGLGKSTAMRGEAARLRAGGGQVLEVDLSSSSEEGRLRQKLVGSDAWQTWLAGEHRLHLFLDALDFALLRMETVVDLLREELSEVPLQRLSVRLACRTAERPRDLESWLQRRFGPDAYGVYELLPLRFADVATAAEASLPVPAAFITTVLHQELQPLAMTPMTLALLLSISAAEGALPDSRAQVYAKGCLALADEVSPARRRSRVGQPTLTATQRIAVARRIAGLMVLSAHASITSDAAAPDADLLAAPMFAGGIEVNRGLGAPTEFDVTEHAVADVLRCGLFTGHGEGRIGFAHQTYAEYLCGCWLASAGFSDAQLDDLLFAPTDDGLRVIPQLRGTAGWVSAHSSVFRATVVQRDPAVLLRADPISLLAEDRALITDAVLRGVANFELGRFDLPVRTTIGHLDHADLADQLRPVLLDPDARVAVREVAADIASASRVAVLEADLLQVALDADAPIGVRDAAVAALREIGRPETLEALIPLALEPLTGDVDDELKGIALSTVWPTVLSVDRMLDALTPPKRTSLWGYYKNFLRQDLVEGLTTADLPIALRRATTWPDARDEPLNALGDAREQVVVRACKHLDDDNVVDALAEYLIAGGLHYDGVLSNLSADEHGDVLADPHGRRRLAKRLVTAQGWDDDRGVLVIGTPAIVRVDDLDVVLGHLATAIGDTTERAWAEVVEALLMHAPDEVADQVFDARQHSPVLRELTEARFGTVVINSAEADQMRERYRHWQEIAAARKQRRRPRFDVREKVARAMELWDEKNLDGYWAVLGWLEQAEAPGRAFATSDPRELPGWSLVGEEVHDFVRKNATQYLNEAPANPEEWFDKRLVHQPAWAAYRAMRLLAEERPDALTALPDEVWARWAPVIMAWPHDGSEDRSFNKRAISELIARAPQAAAVWLHRALRLDALHGDDLWSLRRLPQPTPPEIDAVILRWARDGRRSPGQRASALEALVTRNSDEALALARRLVVPSAVRSEGHRRALAAAAATLLATHRPDADWKRTWPLFDQSGAFGDLVVERLAHQRETAIAPRLTEGQVADLYVWLERRYPRAEDPDDDEVHWVSPRESIGQWRDGLLRDLVTRGTNQAVQAFTHLIAEFPGRPGLLAMRASAVDVARRADWIAPEPSRVLAMAQERTYRWITSAEALRQAVLETLADFQQRLVGIDPQASDVWDTASARPKGEQEIGRIIARFLKDSLERRGVFLAREPEARPSQSGKGRGESIDIFIEALIGPKTVDAPRATVVIELKGVWNAELLTSLRAQLAERYLEPPKHRHGIYLVAWFQRDPWVRTGDGTRYAAAGHHPDPGELRATLTQQARDAESDLGVVVDAVVIDCSLPPVEGPTTPR